MDQSMQEGLLRIGYTFVPFLFAIVGHEYGHGLMAHLWGDDSAKENGRLTLNPTPHLDPIGTLLLPLISMLTGSSLFFGWARPVPINPNRFRKYRPGLFWVSFAGPLANAMMALLCALLFCLMVRFVPQDFIFGKEFKTMLIGGIQINFGLGMFNLLPIPPLDGSKIIESGLSYNAARKFEQLQQYSFFILIFLIATNALSFLSGPILWLSMVTLNLAAALTGATLY
ncbi:site-2 protease family protein [bacterium]|jgi:Zn-dependent protease|nr:site-2 protease family protein [bacterium]